MFKMKNPLRSSLIIFLVAMNLQLFAGWEIVLRHESSDGMIHYDLMLIENHKIKYAQSEGGFIYDSKTNMMKWYFNDMKGYWEANFDELRTGMYDAMKSVTNAILADVPDDQKEMYSMVLNQMSEIWKSPDKQLIDDLKLEIIQTGESENIAGYMSEKYLVKVNGETMEQIYVSPQLNLSKEFNTVKIIEAFSELTIDFDKTFYYVKRSEYKQLWEKGFVMKTIDKDGDTLEVIKVEKREISMEELNVPQGFVPVSAKDIITFQMMQEQNNEFNDWD